MSARLLAHRVVLFVLAETLLARTMCTTLSRVCSAPGTRLRSRAGGQGTEPPDRATGLLHHLGLGGIVLAVPSRWDGNSGFRAGDFVHRGRRSTWLDFEVKRRRVAGID
jgi:hypothetical protein